jgi:hypothetical protein
MNRRSEIVTTGQVSIETYLDGNGPVVVLPSYGQDGGGAPIFTDVLGAAATAASTRTTLRMVRRWR